MRLVTNDEIELADLTDELVEDRASRQRPPPIPLEAQACVDLDSVMRLSRPFALGCSPSEEYPHVPSIPPTVFGDPLLRPIANDTIDVSSVVITSAAAFAGAAGAVLGVILRLA